VHRAQACVPEGVRPGTVVVMGTRRSTASSSASEAELAFEGACVGSEEGAQTGELFVGRSRGVKGERLPSDFLFALLAELEGAEVAASWGYSRFLGSSVGGLQRVSRDGLDRLVSLPLLLLLPILPRFVVRDMKMSAMVSGG
jgi:hypothetical protein